MASVVVPLAKQVVKENPADDEKYQVVRTKAGFVRRSIKFIFPSRTRKSRSSLAEDNKRRTARIVLQQQESSTSLRDFCTQRRACTHIPFYYGDVYGAMCYL
mmetsp:Transcript_5433/g.9763  ORF Transcript_5433/g.9763 Transcript_5433/m.9763 type:complete len:102 (+) Transcript_5433:128-433(+)